MWQPDGWGWRAKIGLLVPHADICPEAEFNAMAPEGVSIHATRVSFQAMGHGGTMDTNVSSNTLEAYVRPPLLDDAAEILAYSPVQCICIALTNLSFLGNVDDDKALTERIAQRTCGIPVTDTCQAALAAFGVLGPKRIAFINPPWVGEDITKRGAEYFEGAGYEVVLAKSAALPGNPFDVHSGTVFEWVRTNVPPLADAVFVGGNGFRTIGAIEALEEDLDIPVLTANQVLFWYALRKAGCRMSVAGYGRIFEERL
jgi:maleate isomerase